MEAASLAWRRWWSTRNPRGDEGRGGRKRGRGWRTPPAARRVRRMRCFVPGQSWAQECHPHRHTALFSSQTNGFGILSRAFNGPATSLLRYLWGQRQVHGHVPVGWPSRQSSLTCLLHADGMHTFLPQGSCQCKSSQQHHCYKANDQHQRLTRKPGGVRCCAH